jgi:multiple sugar transport system ATP-binding protein
LVTDPHRASSTSEQVDTPRTLNQEPDNVFVAGFIGSPAMNLVPFATGADVEFGGVALPLSDSARSPGRRGIG